MKIGIVSNLYPPNARGGAELVAARVADALYERGHEVIVLTSQPYEGLRSLCIRVCERTLEVVYRFFPLNVYYLRNDRAKFFPVRLFWHLIDLWNPLSRLALRQFIAQEHPDIIITHNLKGLGLCIAREIQRQHIPHIHVIHDVQLSVPSGLLLFGEENAWIHRSFLRRLYEKAVKRQIGIPNLVLSPSKFLADFYGARGFFSESRIEVLPNLLPPGDRPKVSSERPATRTQFLFVGQLEKHKGIQILLEALSAFGQEIELHIAGEGSLADLVCEQSQKDSRVTYHGFVSLHHLTKLLKKADAVLIPSICYENSPTIIYEALLVGVPVIASRIGGIPELIEEGETGLLVQPGNTQELIQAMKRIHEHREEWWEKTTFIRERPMNYSLDRYIVQIEKHIKELTISKKNDRLTV